MCKQTMCNPRKTMCRQTMNHCFMLLNKGPLLASEPTTSMVTIWCWISPYWWVLLGNFHLQQTWYHPEKSLKNPFISLICMYIYIYKYNIIYIYIYSHSKMMFPLFSHIPVPRGPLMNYLVNFPLFIQRNPLGKRFSNGFPMFPTVKAMAISYKWWFLWDYTFYKCGFVSTYNWYFGP